MDLRIETNFETILTRCYAADEELLSKWHRLAGKGLLSCVKKDCEDLRAVKAELYVVTEDSELVGYFCKEHLSQHQFLSGFFIMPKFRNPEGKNEFWEIICENFPDPFFCGLYDKNVRAINFIMKRQAIPFKSVVMPEGSAKYYRIGSVTCH